MGLFVSPNAISIALYYLSQIAKVTHAITDYIAIYLYIWQASKAQDTIL